MDESPLFLLLIPLRGDPSSKHGVAPAGATPCLPMWPRVGKPTGARRFRVLDNGVAPSGLPVLGIDWFLEGLAALGSDWFLDGLLNLIIE